MSSCLIFPAPSISAYRDKYGRGRPGIAQERHLSKRAT
ncbi:hypothetical protein FM107_09590 [Sphingobacterium sp. JB170]|nr:hypothetical protein FM107_09590 [Sphingobacterium sp. JB170]